MSISDLSYEQTEKLIKLIEDHYFEVSKELTPEQFADWRINELTKFRRDKLGKYFSSITGIDKDYLRRKLYQRFNEISENRDLKFHPTKDFLAGLAIFFQRDVIPEITGQRKEATKSDKINIFKDSRWVYYYFDEIDGVPGISTGFLQIDGNKEVIIKDKNHETNKDLAYIGSVKPIADNNLLLFTLNTNPTGERDLHILIHIGNSGTKPQIAMGQYHNLDDNYTIVSGTIILADTELFFDGFTPKFFAKGSPGYVGLNKQVKAYFNEKSGNRIKVRHGNLSYALLGKWMNLKKQSIKNTLPKGSVKTFISAPVTALKASDFDNFIEKVELIKNGLESVCDCSCYCALLKLRSQDDTANNLLFKEIVEELQQCQLFVMIFPPYVLDRQTSALIEFGFIYHRRIPIVIFEPIDKKQHIPNLLRGARKVSGNFIRAYKYKTLEDIPSIVSKHGRDLFGL